MGRHWNLYVPFKRGTSDLSLLSELCAYKVVFSVMLSNWLISVIQLWWDKMSWHEFDNRKKMKEQVVLSEGKAGNHRR